MSGDLKTYTLAQIAEHKSEKSCWLIIHGKVYDVTDFLEEHPGGYDIIVSAAGKDATQEFDDIGHSKTAKQLLDKYLIGNYEGGDTAPAKPEVKSVSTSDKSAPSPALRTLHVLLPLILLAVAIALNMMYSKKSSSA